MHDHVVAVGERLRRHAHQSLGERVALGSLHVNGVTFDERSGVGLNPHAQQTATVMLERLQRPLINGERPPTGDGKGDPRLSRRQSYGPRGERRAKAEARPMAYVKKDDAAATYAS